jgi:general secretion pathway protein G
MINYRPNKKRGFTLIELFILLVVFALLTAVMLPRFSAAADETDLSDMVSRLQTLRSQLELYKVQHNDLLPGQSEHAGDIDPEQFIMDLTRKDTIDGFGPYLKQIPANPFLEGNTGQVNIKFVNSPVAEPDVYKECHWWLNAATGELRACDHRCHLKY